MERNGVNKALSGATRVPADEVLEDGTLAGALATDDGDLRQVEVQRQAAGRERVLQPVHHLNQLVQVPVARHRSSEPSLSVLCQGFEERIVLAQVLRCPEKEIT